MTAADIVPSRERVVTAASAGIRTITADWQTCPDASGEDHSPDMLPVVISVVASSKKAALEAAADKLQEHFGPSVENLYRTDIERDDWFGFGGGESLLRVCLVQIGLPILDDESGDLCTRL
ncbi:hypothetical protein [Streptomyces malaysiensis]|uniref:Uncharacterized protein n=1 Tax=Streptomyces malaysiensis TaxID=92644 RepID=A0A7X5XA05_STRMQ|nr:hypothetical protein [Streptomyces malaysiensis]NIY68111.1 hypothetical protein [Streptomyces malaysiensis]